MEKDLTFDVLLARECKARGLARSAPLLARSVATKRLHETGRGPSKDNEDLRQKFVTEALRELRVNALAADDRAKDPKALRVLFDHCYGVDGQRVHVRQILVSFAATRERLAASSGRLTDDDAVHAAARERAQALQLELRAGRDLPAC